MDSTVKIIPVRQGLQHVAIRFLLPSGPLASMTVLWPTALVFRGVPPSRSMRKSPSVAVPRIEHKLPLGTPVGVA